MYFLLAYKQATIHVVDLLMLFITTIIMTILSYHSSTLVTQFQCSSLRTVRDWRPVVLQCTFSRLGINLQTQSWCQVCQRFWSQRFDKKSKKQEWEVVEWKSGTRMYRCEMRKKLIVMVKCRFSTSYFSVHLCIIVLCLSLSRLQRTLMDRHGATPRDLLWDKNKTKQSTVGLRTVCLEQ